MFSLKSKTIKIIASVCATLTVGILPTNALADDANIETILTNIWNDTYWILADVNGLPNFIANWINPDTSPGTATIQGYFSSASAGYSQVFMNNASTVQNRLLSDFFGKGSAAPQNANDLSYGSVLGWPFVSPDPRKDNSIDPAYNYTKNASGLMITHPVPTSSWNGRSDAVNRYVNYYNSVESVQTFDAWVLGETYSELSLGFPFASQQWNLIKQASTSNWFSEVASESIGVVLRQILMYDSQILVALTEMLRIQKEQLEAQAMTNTMLVLTNLQSENYLVKDAQGKIPG